MFRKHKNILMLGGGGARGLVNIGVLKVLEKHFGRENFPFDMIIGTSIGSFIGAGYCLGRTPDDIESQAKGFEWPSLFDLGLYPTGLITSNRLARLIKGFLGEKTFDDGKIPSGRNSRGKEHETHKK